MGLCLITEVILSISFLAMSMWCFCVDLCENHTPRYLMVALLSIGLIIALSVPILIALLSLSVEGLMISSSDLDPLIPISLSTKNWFVMLMICSRFCFE